MAGGGALLALVALIVFIPYHKTNASQFYSAAVVATLAAMFNYVVNYPHFMHSYQLLYGNWRQRMTHYRDNRWMRWKCINAGIVMPVALVILLAYISYAAFFAGNLTPMAYALQSMLFFVGWHYVKQSFGVFMMLSALKKIFYSPKQRRVFLANAYAVWLCSFVFNEYTFALLGPTFRQGYGDNNVSIPYQLPHFPAWLQLTLLGITLGTTMITLWTIARAWRRTGTRPSFSALLGYFSMYYLFAFAAILHPEWALIIPLFHSLQYIMFVTAYKRGASRKLLHAIGLSEQDIPRNREARKIRSKRQEFYAWSFMLGLLSFYAIPAMLDVYQVGTYHRMAPSIFFLLLFQIFINIHHYFIDNIIWRRENKEVGEYLFEWSR